ncbi:MAG: hypothetical protein N2747_08080 [Chitinophagaceae bacterium]|nr:hypothetical protein [Chitinophagaceae bacterium]
MPYSDNNGCLSLAAVAVYIAAWIGSGVLAWKLVDPDSFGGALLFLIAWGMIGAIFHFIAGFIVFAILSKMD